ncbi:tight adherence protein B [Propionispira arboris]|uniref:Tight adherence protein B n=1 Tax=Propionispira arboris TaxID=84035 RepID=A0A1H7BQ75_9FIRM|nr:MULTISPECIES: type II secretion system F family protein [Propionispira]SEJ79739.1 tight adherence protein B [Propionispira arboris]
MGIVAFLSGMLVFVILLMCIAVLSREKIKLTRKVRSYTGPVTIERSMKKKIDYLGMWMNFIRYVGLRLQMLPKLKNFDSKMQQAGLSLLGSEFLAAVCTVSLLSGVLGMMLTMHLEYAAFISIGVAAACFCYLNILISHRKQAFSNQLGDVLSMMSNAMRSGFSFMQAMDLIAKEMKPPVSVEFSKAIAEIQLGADTETALLNIGKRIESSDMDLVITAVLIQRQVGGNLAQILDTIAATINERIKMKREIKTLTAQGRLSSWVLAALPVAVAGLASVMNPQYLDPFFDEPIGRICLAGAIISELIGFWVIRKIVDIDV